VNRRDSGLWGIELPAGDFAQALAALGVLRRLTEPARVSSAEIRLDLSEALKTEEGPVRRRTMALRLAGYGVADEWRVGMEV